MSLLSPSGFETHEAGTLGKNAIIAANFKRLNAMLDPALDDTDPIYGALYGIFARAIDGQASSVLDLGTRTSGTETVDLKASSKQKITAGGNFTIAFDGKKSGRKIDLYIFGSGGTRTITWPGAALWHNDTPITTVGSGKVIHIQVSSMSTTDALIVLK